MKANEAPEKIYLDEDESWHLTNPNGDSIEYTRTDAFIDKACDKIQNLLGGYIIRNFNFGDSYNMDKLIDDFRKTMKGE